MMRDEKEKIAIFICLLALALYWVQVLTVNLVDAQELQTQTREIILGTSDSEFCFDMALDSEDNIILVGAKSETAYSDAEHAFLIAKISSEGDSLWYRSWNRLNHDWLVSVDIDSMDSLIIAGVSSASAETTTRSGIVAKLDPEGQEIWSIVISNIFYEWLTSTYRDGYFSVQVDRSSDDIFVAGTMTGEYERAFLACINASGSIKWERILDDHELGWTVATSLWLTPRSQVVIAMEGQLHSYIMGFDFNGTKLWNVTDISCISGQEMVDENLMLATTHNSLAKYSSDFEKLWELDIELEEPYDGELMDFTLNGTHNLFGYGIIHNVKTQAIERGYQALFTPAPTPQILVLSCSFEGEILEYGVWSKGDYSIPAGCEIDSDGMLILAGHTGDYSEDTSYLFIMIGFTPAGLPSPISTLDYNIFLVIILPLSNYCLIGYFRWREKRFLEEPLKPPRSTYDNLKILFFIELVMVIFFGGFYGGIPVPTWIFYLPLGLLVSFLMTSVILFISWRKKMSVTHEEP